MRLRGTITSWKDDKGFGFITPDGGKDHVFVHITSFSNRQRRPVGNETVIFELKTDSRGRLQAKKVSYSDEHMPLTTSFAYGYSTLILAASFIFFVSVATLVGKLPITVLWFYLITSFITFVLYARDKSAAINDKWRTEESTLHLLALIGCWPGALAAQRLLHHKSKKQSFKIVFWITAFLNCILLGSLFSNQGTKILHSVIDTTRNLF